jgi:hypothetical protein
MTEKQTENSEQALGPAMRFRLNPARFSRRAYWHAREFGRGRLFSMWLQVRFWITGRTGPYRIWLPVKAQTPKAPLTTKGTSDERD